MENGPRTKDGGAGVEEEGIALLEDAAAVALVDGVVVVSQIRLFAGIICAIALDGTLAVLVLLRWSGTKQEWIWRGG